MNILCQVDEMDHRGPDMWPNITLSVSVKVIPDEIAI